MTRFAVKNGAVLHVKLQLSYKIYTTQMNRLQFPLMIIHQTFEHIQVKISNLKLCESQLNYILQNKTDATASQFFEANILLLKS